MSIYKKNGKRVVDIILACVLLIIIFPLLIVIAIALLITTGNKIVFIQERIGKHAKPFKIVKFKTMSDKKDENGKLLPDAMRITKFGNLLRSLSLDELLQLLNVLKGEMSFIGPRPLLKKYLPLYSEFQFRRHEVTPGITGWAQVNGRNNISWTKKFEMDVWYVDNLSFTLDAKIFYMTFLKVIKRHGVSKDGFSTTETFAGNN